MGQQLTGGALALIGLAPYGFVVLDLLGIQHMNADPLFLAYGFLIVFMGIGVYADEIRFEQESTWRYEGLILIFAIVVIITIVGGVFISVV